MNLFATILALAAQTHGRIAGIGAAAIIDAPAMPPVARVTWSTATAAVDGASAAWLRPGETATMSFTLSEPSNDFTQDDVVVTGGVARNNQ